MRSQVPTPNEQGLCDCCFHAFDGDKLWHNGGFAHARCAAEHERLIMGEDAMPGLSDHLDYLDGLQAFIGRLGQAAAALGIDRQQLARAIKGACDGRR